MGRGDRDNAILTYTKLHQYPLYLESLKLKPDVFMGKRILDVGSSAIPSALVFTGAEVYCLEPLLPQQLLVGYPFYAYEQRARFIYGYAEDMPFPSNFFDAVISVNAIDHVDDFILTVKEIRRVLKPGGLIRIHAHYHPSRATEPISLDDNIISTAFSWCQNFKKLHEFKKRRGSYLKSSDEMFTVWSNFQ